MNARRGQARHAAANQPDPPADEDRARPSFRVGDALRQRVSGGRRRGTDQLTEPEPPGHVDYNQAAWPAGPDPGPGARPGPGPGYSSEPGYSPGPGYSPAPGYNPAPSYHPASDYSAAPSQSPAPPGYGPGPAPSSSPAPSYSPPGPAPSHTPAPSYGPAPTHGPGYGPEPGRSPAPGRAAEFVRGTDFGRGTEFGRPPEPGQSVDSGRGTEFGRGTETGRSPEFVRGTDYRRSPDFRRGADFARNPEPAAPTETREEWLKHGQLQYDYLVGQGLQPGDRMLEIGCGTLRAGHLFIGYLSTGNYYGIDISPDKLLTAQRIITEFGLQAKVPHLTLVAPFDLKFLPAARFTVIHAHNVFARASVEMIGAYLAQVRRVMTTDAIFDFTFDRADGAEHQAQRADFYRADTLIGLAGSRGLDAELMKDWDELGQPHSKLRLTRRN